ncbi:16S rRNA (cytosine967-C5)-methyltransferase [Rhodobacteraceae bacterium MBR-64]
MNTISGLAPRRAALSLLAAVMGEGRMLSDLRDDAKGPLAALPPDERARAARLAAGVLRNIGRADRVLGPHLRRAPPTGIHNILRLALVEVFVDGAAPHGAVHSAVALARMEKGGEAFTGLVNAVLRKGVALAPDAWAALAAQKLPAWLRKPLVAEHGGAVVQAIEAAHGAGAPLDITPRRGSDPAGALNATILPTGSLRLPHPGQISRLPGYADGQWWVQDAATALAVPALAPQPGDRVLDLCAAPGGKTLQLADAGARVVAVDISDKRLIRLHENLARTGLAAEVVTADALTWGGAPATFDAVLLDAPCTATGTIRRHPDLPFVKDGSELHSLIPLQAALIDRALWHLRPGGRLVYCTCSLLHAEGEAQIEAALHRHRGLRVDASALALPGVDPAWIGANGLRLRPDYWPDRGGMDGFFIAALRTA